MFRETCRKLLSQSSNRLASARRCGFRPNSPQDLLKNTASCSNYCGRLAFRRGIVGATFGIELFGNPHLRPPERCVSSNAGVAAAEGPALPVRVLRHGLIRSGAQSALFEYLHATRGLEFTLAEHMSKNSPVFLTGLLSNVEAGETDVRRAVSRFLQYHPINEFEPFLESAGLRRAELEKFLPRNLIYLSDATELLENYHVLCNYGVPRTKIGKVYKEAAEVFGYQKGVLPSKLQQYEKLGLGKPTVIKLAVCCPKLLVADANLEFLQVLDKLKTFSIQLNWLRGALSDKSTYNWRRTLEMLGFLETMYSKHLSSKALVVRLVKEHPLFVFAESGRRLHLLVTVLYKFGIRLDRMLMLFVQYPLILRRNFLKNLWRSVDFLARIGMKSSDIARVVCSCPEILGASSCRRPAIVLPSLKISAERLRDIIKNDPTQFGNLVSKEKFAAMPKMDSFFLEEKTDFLLKLGFLENSDEMAKALSQFRGRGDQLQERLDCLVDAGLDYGTACNMIKAVPFILNQSTETLKKKINYLLNDLGYTLESIAVFPAVLGYNLEKMKLRFAMHKWLKENGVEIQLKNRKVVNRSMLALSTVLACSDVRFMKQFVNLHPDGLKEWERLKNRAGSDL